MTTGDLETRLGWQVLTPHQNTPLTTAYASDLLSDVVANAPEGAVLITLLVHKNTVACASLTGAGALVLTGKHPVPDDLLQAARNEGLAVFHTTDNQFTASWKIAQLLGLTLSESKETP